MELNGRTAIITGSGGGIGRALALEFGNSGDTLLNYVLAAVELYIPSFQRLVGATF